MFADGRRATEGRLRGPRLPRLVRQSNSERQRFDLSPSLRAEAASSAPAASREGTSSACRWEGSDIAVPVLREVGHGVVVPCRFAAPGLARTPTTGKAHNDGVVGVCDLTPSPQPSTELHRRGRHSVRDHTATTSSPLRPVTKPLAARVSDCFTGSRQSV